MSLLAFVIACGIGAVIGLADRPAGRIGKLAGLACLAAAFIAALVTGPATRLTIGEVTLAGSEYSGLFLACVAGSGLLLGLVALASGWSDELIPAGLAALAGLAVALTAGDPGVALLAAAAGATAGSLVIAGAVRTTTLGFAGAGGITPRNLDDGRLAETRTIGLVAVGLVLAAIAILRPPWNGPSDGAVFGVAYLALGLALAVRSGAVPFHVPAAHLRRTAVPFSPALLLVWIPAGLGILAVGWSATTFGLRADWVSTAALGVQIVAVATLVLGPLAALVHDELEEVAVYSIVADASFVLLAMAARTDAAAEPARLWLLVFVATKTGLVAWTAALSRAFGTSNLDRLRGWMRRTPLLGVALAVIVVATLGWPGSAVYEARAALIRLALPNWFQFLFGASIVLSLASFARLLAIGLRSPSDDVRGAPGELPRLSAVPAGPTDATVAATTSASDRVPAAGPALAAVAATVAVAIGGATSLERAPGPAADRNSGESAQPATVEPPSPTRRPRTLAGILRLNRTPAVSVIVACGAVLAAALAFGGLGASNASRFGIPLDTAAHATPSRIPTQPPPPTPKPTPQPTFAPRPTSGSSGSAAPTGAASPSASPAPGATSAPARDNTN